MSDQYFNKFDTNHNGSMSYEELKWGIIEEAKALGKPLNNEVY